MYFDRTIRSNLIYWFWVALFAIPNINFVQSKIIGPNTGNATCSVITYYKDNKYQCELTLRANELSERLMLNFNKLELNRNDTLYIYDGPSVSGDPVFKLTYENVTGTMIYSTNNSLSLELVTADSLGFDSDDFYLAYTPFNGSENGCNDGFVCRDEHKYCIPQDYICNVYIHCSDGSDEGVDVCQLPDDSDDMKLKMIALACFAGFILLLGCIWLCAHTRKTMRNRAAIQRNGVVNN